MMYASNRQFLFFLKCFKLQEKIYDVICARISCHLIKAKDVLRSVCLLYYNRRNFGTKHFARTSSCLKAKGHIKVTVLALLQPMKYCTKLQIFHSRLLRSK